MAKKKDLYKPVNVKNRKAKFNYAIEDTYVAGMVLKGTEIKSIRLGRVTLGEAYCYVNNGEVFVKNMNIAPYEMGTHFNHAPTRERKLLLNKKEIRKIERSMEEQGMTIVPMRLFMSRGFAKLEIGIGKGKKLHDKRESLKEKDAKRKLRAADY